MFILYTAIICFILGVIYLEILTAASALASAIDAKDKYTHGHSSRVAVYSEKIARLIWHCPFVDLFYSDDKMIEGRNYREFALIRLDGESWDTDEKADNTMMYSLTDEFSNWDDWKARNKQGLECTVTFSKNGNTIIVRGELGGVAIRSTTVINDDVSVVYAALTGDQCALTNIRIH